MPYQSPIHIYLYFNPNSALELIDLSRLQKQCIAELNLSGNTPLQINGAEYSKDDLLKTIQHLKEEKNLQLHISVFINQSALRFLEDPSEMDSADDILEFCTILKESKDFVLFQQLLSDAICFYLKNILTAYTYEKYLLLPAIIRFLNPAQLIQVNEIIANHIISLRDAALSYLSNSIIIANAGDNITNGFPFLYEDDFVSFLNLLTDDFYFLKSELLEAFCDLVELNSGNLLIARNDLLKIINQLLQVEGVEHVIKDRLLTYRERTVSQLHWEVSPVALLRTGDADRQNWEITSTQRYGEEILTTNFPWESEVKNEEEEQDEDEHISPSVLTRLRYVMASRKSMKIAGILIVVSGSLCFLLRNDFPSVSGFLLIICILVFVLFIAFPAANRRN